jgi:CheY-like chemotaxis protein
MPRKINILLAYDKEPGRFYSENTQARLEAEPDFSVTTCGDAGKVLRYVNSRRFVFDIIIIDGRLDNKGIPKYAPRARKSLDTGAYIYKQVRRKDQTKEVPVVMVTTNHSELVRLSVAALSSDHHLAVTKAEASMDDSIIAAVRHFFPANRV